MRRSCVAAAAALLLAGCGLSVQSPDLFLLTRSGQGHTVSLLVNDDGTIRCNGSSKTLPDPQLLAARDLAKSLAPDAKANLTIPPSAKSVFRYVIKLQDGTISFPDTAGARHQELAQAELFAVQVTHSPCGLSP